MSRNRDKMILRFEEGKKILIRLTHGRGLKEWKITRVGKDFVELEYILTKVKPCSWECNLKEHGYIRDYIVDPVSMKVIRAKRAYPCAYIHEKERDPIVFYYSADQFTVERRNEFFWLEMTYNRELPLEEMRPIVFYPRTATAYKLNIFQM